MRVDYLVTFFHANVLHDALSTFEGAHEAIPIQRLTLGGRLGEVSVDFGNTPHLASDWERELKILISYLVSNSLEALSIAKVPLDLFQILSKVVLGVFQRQWDPFVQVRSLHVEVQHLSVFTDLLMHCEGLSHRKSALTRGLLGGLLSSLGRVLTFVDLTHSLCLVILLELSSVSKVGSLVVVFSGPNACC